MGDSFRAVIIQNDRYNVTRREEISEFNLKRALHLLDFSIPRFSTRRSPVKLIAFPEVFLQGWCVGPGSYSSVYERVAKDVAIRIPGEETDLIGKKAKEHNCYIAGSAMEVIPELGENYNFNCSFIIDPNGEVIYKRHKLDPAVALTPSPKFATDGVSPHDVYDRYLDVMDGKYGRKEGDILSCFFPVVETDIGKLGCIICMEGFFPENARALAIQGCEVMVRCSGYVEPFGASPYDSWELQNRSAAQSNLMYVVAPSSGAYLGDQYPRNYMGGHSMIVDFEGITICHANYHGETVSAANIDVKRLRERRADPSMNYLVMLRTEVLKQIYARSLYPKNLFLNGMPTLEERMKAVPLQKFLEKRIFIPPDE